MKVSVIILNWNAEALLKRFLPSTVQHSVLPAALGDVEVVVADNGSTDGSLAFVRAFNEQLPADIRRVRVVPFPENLGFAEGYNRALAATDAEYSVLLNDDAEVTEGWLEPMVRYMDAHPTCAACQPKLLSQRDKTRFEYAGAAGGFVDRYGYPFCRGRVFDTVEEDRRQYDADVPLLWATGACLMVRTQEYLAAGGLDARFFAHMEEVDLCWRLRTRGKEIRCVAESTVCHVGGATLGAESPRKTYLNFRNNLLMLYKNLPPKELHRVLFVRSLLDVVAAAVFLLKGEGAHCRAVFRARRDYRKMRPSYAAQRQENLVAAAAAGNASMTVAERRRYSILIRYRLKGRHTFADIDR